MKIILIIGLLFVIPTNGKAIFDDKALEQAEDQIDAVENEDNPLITAILDEEEQQKDDDKNMELVRLPRQPSPHENMQNLWRIDPPHPRTLASKLHLIRGLLGPDLKALLPLLGGAHHPAPPPPVSPYIAGYTLTPILAPHQPIIPPNALPHLAPPLPSPHANCPQPNPSSLLANIPPQLIQLFLSSLQNAPPGARANENNQDQMVGVMPSYLSSLNYPSDPLAVSDFDYPINLYMDPNQLMMRSGQENLFDQTKSSSLGPPSLDVYGKHKRDSELNTLANTL